MAGEFAVHLRDGDVYSVEEVRDWLPTNGLALRRPRPARRAAERDHRRGGLTATSQIFCDVIAQTLLGVK